MSFHFLNTFLLVCFSAVIWFVTQRSSPGEYRIQSPLQYIKEKFNVDHCWKKLNMTISPTYISNFALIWKVPQPAENNTKKVKNEPEQRNSVNELIIMIHLKYC